MPELGARARMTAAAFDLFAEHGFDATTIDEIAARAGVGRSTFFRNFGTKEDVIFPDHEEILGKLQARLAASSRDTALVAITDAARIVLTHYLDEGAVAQGRYQLTSKVPALRDREIASAQQYRLVFKRYILDWLGGEPSSELRADLMAAAVVTAHNHVLRRWLRGQTSEPLTDLDQAMAQVSTLFGRDSAEGGATVVVLRSALDVDVLLPRLREALAED